MNHLRCCLLSFCVATAATAQEPLDLFSDAPRLAPGYVRIGAWNLRHINLEDGADLVLPGASREDDFRSLIATFAKAIQDLGLDLVAVVEHQPRPGEPNRLAELAEKLTSLGGKWAFAETHIEYDREYDRETNAYGALQFGLLWNRERGIAVDPAAAKLLVELRQPRDAEGRLTKRETRVPWLVPVTLESGGGKLALELIVLHLKSGGVAPQGAEVDSLVEFIARHQAAPAPRHLVVLGDWNLRPDHDFNGAGRPRLRKMMVPTATGPRLRILTVDVLRPSLDDWEQLDSLVGALGSYPPLETVLPFTHFPINENAPYTLLDHIAISRTLDDIFRHPLPAVWADGRRDWEPGIRIPRPSVGERTYSRLTDHLPVVMTLKLPAGG